MQDFYPNIKFAIGPPIENGFYYDIDLGDEHIGDKDFEKIEAKMLELARERTSTSGMKSAKPTPLNTYKKGDDYKLELLDDLGRTVEITFYKQGNFTDLCRGPHIPNTGFIKAAKLMSVAGAYWRGDEKNKQLTRIY